MTNLMKQVRDVADYRSTKAEIVSYFKATYPKGWQTKLVNTLFPFTKVKNAHNLERRFNPDRVNNAPRGKKEKAEYEELGRMLPPLAPKKGIQVTGIIFIDFSGSCEERELDTQNMPPIPGNILQRVFNGELDIYQVVIDTYMTDDVDGDEHQPPCNIKGWKVKVKKVK